MNNYKVIDEQTKILREIQDKGFNIINCALCGSVNIVHTAKELFTCYDCSEQQQHHDCADLF